MILSILYVTRIYLNFVRSEKTQKQIEIAFLVRQEVYLKYAFNRFSDVTVSKTSIQIYFFLLLATDLPQLMSNLFLLICKFENKEPIILGNWFTFRPYQNVPSPGSAK